jgi:hypothetical protein
MRKEFLHMTDKSRFVDLVNGRLIELDRSMSWLASKVDVHPATIARWLDETYLYLPSKPYHARIASALTMNAEQKLDLFEAVGLVYRDSSEASSTAEETRDGNDSNRVSQINTNAHAPDRGVDEKSTTGIERQLEEIKAMLELPGHLAPPEPALWPAGLPSTEPYYSLPERDRRIEEIMATLRAPKGRQIIAIDGLGGLGKTALAVEIGRRCLLEGLLQRVVGDSAKQERLVGERIEELEGATLSFDNLLDSIARQLGRWDIPTMKPEEKQVTLRYLLQHNPYLIIVDNLETADNARSLMMELRGFVNGSRAIVTSRPQLALDFVYSLSLKGLDVTDSLVFLREEARSRNRPEILEAPDEKLGKIHEVTGGAPLAMKLVVGQASALPLDVVLENLRQAKGAMLYRFIYLESWGLLSVEAQKLLIYMGTVVTTCAYRELASVGIADDEETLQEAIKETTRLSLLNPVQVDDQMRYGIHQLTHHFVNSELPAIWKEQGLL